MDVIYRINTAQNCINEWCLLSSYQPDGSGSIVLGSTLLEILESWLDYISQALQARDPSYRTRITLQRIHAPRMDLYGLQQSLQEAGKICDTLSEAYGCLPIYRTMRQAIEEMQYAFLSCHRHGDFLSDDERIKSQILLFIIKSEDD